jgi:hypothetical protein
MLSECAVLTAWVVLLATQMPCLMQVLPAWLQQGLRGWPLQAGLAAGLLPLPLPLPLPLLLLPLLLLLLVSTLVAEPCPAAVGPVLVEVPCCEEQQPEAAGAVPAAPQHLLRSGAAVRAGAELASQDPTDVQHLPQYLAAVNEGLHAAPHAAAAHLLGDPVAWAAQQAEALHLCALPCWACRH